MAKTEGSQGEEEVLRARDVSGAGLWKLERDDRCNRKTNKKQQFKPKK